MDHYDPVDLDPHFNDSGDAMHHASTLGIKLIEYITVVLQIIVLYMDLYELSLYCIALL